MRTDPRAASLHWVIRTLAAQHPGEQLPGQLAESLLAIAEQRQVPVESLIEWLHFNQPDTRAWRVWCEAYDAAREELAAEQEKANAAAEL